MARQLRHHYAGGWYHITARGMGRHGDYGRDLALHIGRLKCRLTLRELGKEGGMSVPGVAKACERMRIRLQTDRTVQKVSARVIQKLNRTEA